MIWLGLGIGYCVGALSMWIYLLKIGLHRTRGEHQLAKVLGDEQMNYFCEEAAGGFK